MGAKRPDSLVSYVCTVEYKVSKKLGFESCFTKHKFCMVYTFCMKIITEQNAKIFFGI